MNGTQSSSVFCAGKKKRIANYSCLQDLFDVSACVAELKFFLLPLRWGIHEQQKKNYGDPVGVSVSGIIFQCLLLKLHLGTVAGIYGHVSWLISTLFAPPQLAEHPTASHHGSSHRDGRYPQGAHLLHYPAICWHVLLYRSSYGQVDNFDDSWEDDSTIHCGSARHPSM